MILGKLNYLAQRREKEARVDKFDLQFSNDAKPNTHILVCGGGTMA